MSDWWSRKLAQGGTTPSLPHTPPPLPRRPFEPSPDPLPPVAPAHKLPASARTVDRCPECNSGNFMVQGQVQHCFDCGYPRLQSGSGAMASGSSNTPTKKATQVPTSGYQPTVIVGHVQ